MSSTSPTRRIGRLRTLLVLAAMAVGMIAGGAAPAFAGPPENVAPKGFEQVPEHVQAPSALQELFNGADEFTTAGWSWFR